MAPGLTHYHQLNITRPRQRPWKKTNSDTPIALAAVTAACQTHDQMTTDVDIEGEVTTTPFFTILHQRKKAIFSLPCLQDQRVSLNFKSEPVNFELVHRTIPCTRNIENYGPVVRMEGRLAEKMYSMLTLKHSMGNFDIEVWHGK